MMRAVDVIDRLADLQDLLLEVSGLIQKAADICGDLESTDLGDVLDRSADAAEFCNDSDALSHEGREVLANLISEMSKTGDYLPRHAREVGDDF